MMRRIGRRDSEASPTSVDIEGMGGDDAAEHAHGAAGIAAIERRGGRAQAAQAAAVDRDERRFVLAAGWGS